MEYLHKKIYELENSLLHPEVRKSKEMLELLLADDFVEFGGSGKIYNKLDILDRLPTSTDRIEYNLTNFGIRILSDDTVLSTFKIERVINGTDRSVSLRSSLWRKNGDSWQIFFHQGTIIHD